MGNSNTKQDNFKHHELRFSSMPIRIPMPDDPAELERRFTKVLNSMDLPPDKAKLLKNYDDEKKWELVCDQEKVQVKNAPEAYLIQLRTYLDPRSTRSTKLSRKGGSMRQSTKRMSFRRKMLGDTSSTQVLRDLEISLRTNHIEWVREFLSEENQGLDILVDYLSFSQVLMRKEQLLNLEKSSSLDTGLARSSMRGLKRSNTISTSRGISTKYSQKLNMGEARDDVHVCIMCLRAIMNHQNQYLNAPTVEIEPMISQLPGVHCIHIATATVARRTLYPHCHGNSCQAYTVSTLPRQQLPGVHCIHIATATVARRTLYPHCHGNSCQAYTVSTMPRQQLPGVHRIHNATATFSSLQS
ncbi:hypothetical protein DPMN_062208 [Dreissena polymorpha]|uniref:GBD/FH3 domain-containing protein n=1 Tax=Dreissena polymorpha TaxID=45954 RepID=A0A9D4HJZ5_DREPO|nr:hypothetical protein DPMN_062208 [Dreissena polymorpha]